MKKLKKLSLGLAMSIATLGATSFMNEAHATCNPGDYMGSVCWVAGNYCPRGYFYANGDLLSIGQYSTLFSIIGTAYGGDGRTTFGLPDLRGRTAVGTGHGPGLYHNVYGGMWIGIENLYMNTLYVAPHQHSIADVTASVIGAVNAVTTAGTEVSPELAHPAARPGTGKVAQNRPIYTANFANSAMAADALTVNANSFGTVTTSKAGSKIPQGIPMRPPQQAFMACINFDGLYPPRP